MGKAKPVVVGDTVFVIDTDNFTIKERVVEGIPNEEAIQIDGPRHSRIYVGADRWARTLAEAQYRAIESINQRLAELDTQQTALKALKARYSK
jgi:hypothetical protein